MKATRLLIQGGRSMARYKLRTGFMMLGSLVGVAALTLVVSLGQGVQAKVVQTVRQVLGDGSILIISGGSRIMGSPRAGAARLTLDDLEAVAKEVTEVDAWDPQAELAALTVRRGDATATVRVLGQSERWEQVWSRPVARGRSFDAAAVASSARVAVIGETAARTLFAGEDPLDGEIRIGAVSFQVIGVLERFGTDMHGMDRDNEIVVPISTLMRRLTNLDAITAANLLVKDPARTEETARSLRRVLRARHALDRDRPDDFMIVTALEAQKMVGSIQRILLLFVPLVAGVALIAGGIVAAMLMLASVSQRVWEIGLRRAVGAQPDDIRLQFAIETAGTIVAGGLAGLVLGYIGVQAVATWLQLSAPFSWQAVLLSLVASAVTGVLAGVAPARRAARLDPAHALR
jgi:putative ABC transport system permease protein